MNTNDKMIEVVKKMIAQPGDLSDLCESNTEVYFSYLGHAFSISFRRESDQYIFFVYPQWKKSISALASNFEIGDPDEIKYISFSTEAFPHFKEYFVNLYNILEAKIGGLDDIFNDILDSPHY